MASAYVICMYNCLMCVFEVFVHVCFSVCICEHMRSPCVHLCDKLVQLCMLSVKAYHGTVFELEGASSLRGLLALLYLLCPKPQEKPVGNWVGGLTNWEGKGQDWTSYSVRRDGASAQAAARQALEDAHGDVHERAEIEE